MQIKALACELPAQRHVPLSRWSLAELTRHVCQSGLVDNATAGGDRRVKIRVRTYEVEYLAAGPNFGVHYLGVGGEDADQEAGNDAGDVTHNFLLVCFWENSKSNPSPAIRFVPPKSPAQNHPVHSPRHTQLTFSLALLPHPTADLHFGT